MHAATLKISKNSKIPIFFDGHFHWLLSGYGTVIGCIDIGRALSAQLIPAGRGLEIPVHMLVPYNFDVINVAAG